MVRGLLNDLGSGHVPAGLHMVDFNFLDGLYQCDRQWQGFDIARAHSRTVSRGLLRIGCVRPVSQLRGTDPNDH
jgi:hypothetical protein